MLDIKRIRENTDEVRDGLLSRGKNAGNLDQILDLDKNRRHLLSEAESLKNRRNKTSKEIGERRKKGEDTSETQKQVRQLGEKITELDSQVHDIDTQLHDLLLATPNVPHKSTPQGTDETFNKQIRTYSEPAKFNFKPKNHVELGENLGILDLGRATRMTGPGFPLFIGAGAKLVRALIQFMLDIHTREHGYTEIQPPILCSSESMTGTGQLPKLSDDMYQLPEDNLYLVPTAEVPLVNMFREEIIDKPLPIYLTAYTPCFRREAGAAGKVTRGIIRMHQFDKVEMVKIVEPETSYDELEKLLSDAEDILKQLELPYRVMELCAGDISFAATKCYDIELWAPGQNAWLEVSSCSNCEDFQARRANIRYKDKDGHTRFPHTLNGSGVALSRLIVAILENCQMSDGSITVPDALAPYMNGTKNIVPE